LDEWKTRYSKLEITLVEYRAYEDRLKEYENRIALLTQEIERLNGVLRQRAEEIDNWKSRYSKIEISITEYKGLEGRLREYENRIALLSQEIERLNGVLKSRADEIEQWRVNYSKLEITINEYKVIESRGKDMEGRVSMLLREIDDWKSRYSKLEISIGEYRNLEGRLKEYENRLVKNINGVNQFNNLIELFSFKTSAE
jgi:uncharacterized small protein (DUF1192 family)